MNPPRPPLPGQPGFATPAPQPGFAPRPPLPGQPGFATPAPQPGVAPRPPLPGQPGFATSAPQPGFAPRPPLPGQPGFATPAPQPGFAPRPPAPGGAAPQFATPGPRPQPVPLGGGAQMTPRPDGRGFVAVGQAPNGGQAVLSQQALPNGQNRFQAYGQRHDPASGTTTRTFLDGRRVTAGPGFVTTGGAGRPAFTRFNDGRREAVRPDGRPLYREAFVEDGGRRMLRRTIFAVGAGAVVGAVLAPRFADFLPHRFGPAQLFVFAPPPPPPALYGWVEAPFASPVGFCPYCAPEFIAFEGPPEPYANPYDMLGDMQLASGFESYDDPGLKPGDLPPDPEVMALAEQVAALEAQLAKSDAANEEMRQQLAAELAALRQPPQRPRPLSIPPDLREQMRRQVRETTAALRSQQGIALDTLLASPAAERQVFQLVEPLNAASAAGSGECGLTPGDMLRLHQRPGEDAVAATMVVAASRAGNCPAGSTMDVSLADLQDMLNGFALRLQDNMQLAFTQAGAAPPASGR